MIAMEFLKQKIPRINLLILSGQGWNLVGTGVDMDTIILGIL